MIGGRGIAGRIAVCCTLLLLAVMTPARALDKGVRTEAPAATSTATPRRQALLVAPGDLAGQTASDADAYRSLLLLLGFDVTTVAVDDRPSLEQAVRGFSEQVSPDAEIAIFLLGTMLASNNELFATAATPSPDILDHPGVYGSEALRIGDLLQRIAERHPRDIVAIIDGCRDPSRDRDCSAASGALPDVASVITSRRIALHATEAPVGHLDSLRADLLPLMRTPGLSFIALNTALAQRIDHTDLALSTTPTLSRSLAFLPQGFLEGLSTDCNRVDATMDDESLRRTDLQRWARACSSAASTYDFTTRFRDRLDIVREQIAYIEATRSCDALERTGGYLDRYADGQHRAAAQAYAAHCAARRTAPPPQPTPPPVAGPPLRSASFTCRPDLAEPIARLICSDPVLSEADGQLGVAFRNKLASLGSPAEKAALIHEEGAWVARRNAICGVPRSGTISLGDLERFKPCVLRAVRERARDLAP